MAHCEGQTYRYDEEARDQAKEDETEYELAKDGRGVVLPVDGRRFWSLRYCKRIVPSEQEFKGYFLDAVERVCWRVPIVSKYTDISSLRFLKYNNC